MSRQSREKLFFEFLHKRDPVFKGKTFYDAAAFDWTQPIETNYRVIYDEVIAFFEKHQKQFYPYFNTQLMNAPGKWRSFGFYFWGLRADKNTCDQFSQTIALLKGIPGVVSASVSIMEPGSEIKPHYGDTNAIIRSHFGLLIPGTLPDIGFQVGYEKKGWQNGKFLLFNDSAYHKAWNYTDQQRIILIVDVIRPEFSHKKLWVCARVHTIMSSQKRISHYPKLTGLIKLAPIQWILTVFKWIYLSTIKRSRLWL